MTETDGLTVRGDYWFPEVENSQISLYNSIRKATNKTAAAITKQAENRHLQAGVESAYDSPNIVNSEARLMGFLDMGTLEIILILVVALIIWGPGKIPEIARTLGKTLRTLRKVTYDLTTAVTKELDIEEKDRPPQSTANSGDKTKKSSDVGTAEPQDEEVTSPRDQ